MPHPSYKKAGSPTGQTVDLLSQQAPVPSQPVQPQFDADVVAKAVAAELAPRLEELLARLQDGFSRLECGLAATAEAAAASARAAAEAAAAGASGHEAAGEAEGRREGAVIARLDTLALRLEKLLQSADTLLDARGAPQGVDMKDRLDSLERHLSEKVEESSAQILHTVDHPPEGPANLARATARLDAGSPNARALTLVSDECGLTEVDDAADPELMGKTFVINIRRLATLRSACRAYTCVVPAGAALGLGAVVLAGDARLLAVDLAFLLAGCALHAVHYLRHGTLTVGSSSTLGLAELVGQDGRALLEEAIPSIDNPNGCILALAGNPRRAYYFSKLALGGEAFLLVACLVNWVLLLCLRAGSIGKDWTDGEADHFAALNALATAYLSLHFAFGLVAWRELRGVLPPKRDGKPWDVAKDGAPGTLGWLMGPPCVWFGSPEAYDDVRIWTAMASRRSRRWAIDLAAPPVHTVEMGACVLQGRMAAARLARALRGAKLFDGHRRVFLKRLLPEQEGLDHRPTVVVTDLARGARGRLRDMDMHRELPETLNVHLLLYDSQTRNSWALSETGQDPLDWVDLKPWAHESEKTPHELPVWNPGLCMGSGNSVDVFPGTFGGSRCLVYVARGGSSSGSETTGFADVLADAMALRKIGEHPNIVAMLTSGTSPDGRPFMATESYEAMGCLLSHIVNQCWWAGATLPHCLTTQLFHGLVEALAHLHRHGLIHRSLQADAVIVTWAEQAKLADMGMVAKKGARDQVRAFHIAPEVCQGGLEQGPSADCWGLGVVLHEIYQGHANLVDYVAHPLRLQPGVPSSLREMESAIREAMLGLLAFETKKRWSLGQLQASRWFVSVRPRGGGLARLAPDIGGRPRLRRFLGRAAPPAACVARVDAEDRGLVGARLGDLRLEDTGAKVLLITRSSGTYCWPGRSSKLEAGDSVCFGLPPNGDAGDAMVALGYRLARAAAARPPVSGFQPARPGPGVGGGIAKATPSGAVADGGAPPGDDAPSREQALRRLVPFSAEFDCFFSPDHTAGYDIDVGSLHSLGIPVVGLLPTGHWHPDWFPISTTPLHPGDLVLVLRAPAPDGLSAPTMSDSDMDIFMNEKELAAQLAVHIALQKAS